MTTEIKWRIAIISAIALSLLLLWAEPYINAH